MVTVEIMEAMGDRQWAVGDGRRPRHRDVAILALCVRLPPTAYRLSPVPTDGAANGRSRAA